MNTYLYANSNPLKFMDVMGLRVTDAIWDPSAENGGVWPSFKGAQFTHSSVGDGVINSVVIGDGAIMGQIVCFEEADCGKEEERTVGPIELESTVSALLGSGDPLDDFFYFEDWEIKWMEHPRVVSEVQKWKGSDPISYCY